MSNKITLKEAIKFHGHLGPYLILGLLAGEAALKKLNCRKYFALEVKVWGATQKPKSCLIDGLQLSTGATYGKGNINKFDGRIIKVEFNNRENQKQLNLNFKNSLMKRLEKVKTHQEAELLAKQLSKTSHTKLFSLKLKALSL